MQEITTLSPNLQAGLDRYMSPGIPQHLYKLTLMGWKPHGDTTKTKGEEETAPPSQDEEGGRTFAFQPVTDDVETPTDQKIFEDKFDSGVVKVTRPFTFQKEKPMPDGKRSGSITAETPIKNYFNSVKTKISKHLFDGDGQYKTDLALEDNVNFVINNPDVPLFIGAFLDKDITGKSFISGVAFQPPRLSIVPAFLGFGTGSLICIYRAAPLCAKLKIDP